MNCKNFRNRRKKGSLYFFCVKKKKEITYNDCKYCNDKEYKQYNTLKSRSNKLAKKEKERFSIIYSDLTTCCNCGSKIDIEKNEIFEGAHRQLSIKLGMVCPFCKNCHDRFHTDIMFNLNYKVKFENKFLKSHSKEEFIKMFGQDYIFKLERKKKEIV